MTILTLPTWAEFLAGCTAWAADPFTEFLPLVYITVGLTGAVLLLHWFKDTLLNAFHYLFGRHEEE